MRHRVAFMAVISVGLTGCAAAPTRAESVYRASVSPSTIDFPRTKELSYRLGVATGDQAESVSLELVEPAYSARQVSEPGGSPLDLGEPRLEGAGRLVVTSIGHIDFAAAGCYRGFLTSQFPRYRLEVPARTRSTVVVRARPARDAPWPKTDHRVRFNIDRGRIKVRSPRPRLTGRRGVRIRLWTRPRTASFFDLLHFGKGNVLRRMRDLSIRGRTDPPIRGQVIRLRVTHDRRRRVERFPPDRSRLLAAVRVDRRGRFMYRWRPPLTGRYQIYATYRRQHQRLAADRSCPIGFDVRD